MVQESLPKLICQKALNGLKIHIKTLNLMPATTPTLPQPLCASRPSSFLRSSEAWIEVSAQESRVLGPKL